MQLCVRVSYFACFLICEHNSDSIYARMDNPTRLLLERTLFEIECTNVLKQMTNDEIQIMQETTTTKSSFVFSSGLMGVTSIILAHSSPLTVILPDDLYHGVSSLLVDVFRRHRVSTIHVDMRNIQSVKDTIETIDPEHDCIVWIETPSNPKCHVLDIRSICEAVTSSISSSSSSNKNRKVTTVVDGTLSSPILTRPLEVRSEKEHVTVFVLIFVVQLVQLLRLPYYLTSFFVMVLPYLVSPTR
jgi:cystathionine gamma-synthase